MRKFENYTLELYQSDLNRIGLAKTWSRICRHLLDSGPTPLLAPENLGRLYEIGLARRDKTKKKKSGQYYTPSNVARVMCEWFETLPGKNVCDVGCGTGQLVLAYLERLGRAAARRLIRSGRLYLYDSDPVALKICKTVILLRYGTELSGSLHARCVDFLSRGVRLPKDCKTISNPPYASIKSFSPAWEPTPALLASREYYAAFMEKIIRQSGAAVVITPFSFISGKKFYSLRLEMNARRGEIYSFDNVPGNIFSGKKQGVFNSNTSNSVRPAITVIRPAEKGENGFRLTPLIRFKTEERGELLSPERLESFLTGRRQTVSPAQPMFRKPFRRLEPVYEKWLAAGCTERFAGLTAPSGSKILSMVSTCRYYTTAYDRPLSRKGQFLFTFDDEDKFCYAFCLLNSSFAYWYWRMYDGGINYPKTLLMNMPVFYGSLSRADKAFFRNTAEEMIRLAPQYMTAKNNVGVQENIKYPAEWREKINRRLLRILGAGVPADAFGALHANSARSLQ